MYLFKLSSQKLGFIKEQKGEIEFKTRYFSLCLFNTCYLKERMSTAIATKSVIGHYDARLKQLELLFRQSNNKELLDSFNNVCFVFFHFL